MTITPEEIAATTPEKANDAAVWLLTSFDWKSRPEGRDFWADIYESLYERAKEPS